MKLPAYACENHYIREGISEDKLREIIHNLKYNELEEQLVTVLTNLTNECYDYLSERSLVNCGATQQEADELIQVISVINVAILNRATPICARPKLTVRYGMQREEEGVTKYALISDATAHKYAAKFSLKLSHVKELLTGKRKSVRGHSVTKVFK